MTTIPAVAPPEPRPSRFARDLPWYAAFGWLSAGWTDFKRYPTLSLIYGLGVCLTSWAVVYGLLALGLGHLLFPALAGFLVVGPMLASGLYEKSRRLDAGAAVVLTDMVFVRAKSGGQVMFVGVLLCLLMVLWVRVAVLIYALFFGLVPIPGLDSIVPMLFTTPTGWAMLTVGTLIGGLFAAFAFAISVFAVPMLLDTHTDALTAMGTSMTMVWRNLPVMLVWGFIVMVLTILGIATLFLGFIVVFPLLGHATWRAYVAMRPA